MRSAADLKTVGAIPSGGYFGLSLGKTVLLLVA